MHRRRGLAGFWRLARNNFTSSLIQVERPKNLAPPLSPYAKKDRQKMFDEGQS
jgi:hypothetical protein